MVESRPNNTTSRELLRQAVAAAKAGDKASARGFVRQALELDPLSEQIRMAAAALSASVAEAMPHVEQVLRINPRNEEARVWLEKVRKGAAAKTASTEPKPAPPAGVAEGPNPGGVNTRPESAANAPQQRSLRAAADEDRHLTLVERLLAERGLERPPASTGGPAIRPAPADRSAAAGLYGDQTLAGSRASGGAESGGPDRSGPNRSGPDPGNTTPGGRGPAPGHSAGDTAFLPLEQDRGSEHRPAQPPEPARLAASPEADHPEADHPAGNAPRQVLDPAGQASADRNGPAAPAPAGPSAWRCPLCERPAEGETRRCPHCYAAIHLAAAEMVTRHEKVDETALRLAITRLQAVLDQGPDAAAHVALALAHLNLNESADGLLHLRQACSLRANDRELQEAFRAVRRRKLVVVAEEDETVRGALVELLENYRLRTRPAANGFQALSLVEEEMPDLILASASMPRMGGYELCKVVRGNASTKGIPVVVLAAKAGLVEKARGHAAGATGCLTKPIDGHALLRLLKTLLPDSTLPDPKLASNTVLRI